MPIKDLTHLNRRFQKYIINTCKLFLYVVYSNSGQEIQSCERESQKNFFKKKSLQSWFGHDMI